VSKKIDFEFLGVVIEQKNLHQFEDVYLSVKNVIDEEIEHFYFKGMLGDVVDIENVEYYAFTKNCIVIINPFKVDEKVNVEFTSKRWSDVETMKLTYDIRENKGVNLNIIFSDGQKVEFNVQVDSNGSLINRFCEKIEDIYRYGLKKMR
jgi:hypothetical protein